MDRRLTGYRLYRYCSLSARALFGSCSVAEQQHVQSLSRDRSTAQGSDGCVKYKIVISLTLEAKMSYTHTTDTIMPILFTKIMATRIIIS